MHSKGKHVSGSQPLWTGSLLLLLRRLRSFTLLSLSLLLSPSLSLLISLTHSLSLSLSLSGFTWFGLR